MKNTSVKGTSKIKKKTVCREVLGATDCFDFKDYKSDGIIYFNISKERRINSLSARPLSNPLPSRAMSMACLITGCSAA